MQSSKAITESSQSVCSDGEARSQTKEGSYTPEFFEERRGVCNRNVEILNIKFL